MAKKRHESSHMETAPPVNYQMTIKTQFIGHLCQNPSDIDKLFNLIHCQFDPRDRILWCWQDDPEKLCFTLDLLSELLQLFATVKRSWSARMGPTFPFHYLVHGSRNSGVFNLGGDLALFVQLIRAGDTEGLRSYARLCIDAVYQNHTKSELPYLSAALIQGDALGGGFESALSNDIIVAEEHCRFGLPESLFNMFPGMGAYSFLSRKVGAKIAGNMILSGRLYTAQDLHDLGLIDLVVPTGEGEVALRGYLDQARRHQHQNRVSLSRISRRCEGIDYDELVDIADIWVEQAMGVSKKDLRHMERLVYAQQRKHGKA
ncbi:MAG: crotonase/enoyl-CoA hydratase family protein [Geminicoccales bacterium]